MLLIKYFLSACVIALTLGAAQAEVVTFDVSGVFNDPRITMLHPPENLSGTLTVDVTSGDVIAADLAVAGFSHFTNIFHSFEFFVPTWTMDVLNSSGNLLDFQFTPTPAPQSDRLIGLTSGVITGGELYTACSEGTAGCGSFGNFPGDHFYKGFFGGNPLHGSLTMSAVPEPSTWGMMLLGFAGLGYMAYGRKSNSALLA